MSTKEKIYTALLVIAGAVGFILFLEVLRAFLFFCEAIGFTM